MPVKLVQSTPSAYRYPLLIKQLLLTPLAICTPAPYTSCMRLPAVKRRLHSSAT